MYIIRCNTYDGTSFSSLIYQNAVFPTLEAAQAEIEDMRKMFPQHYDVNNHYYVRTDIIELYPFGSGPRVVVHDCG